MATDARIKKNECIRGKNKRGYFIIGIALFLSFLVKSSELTLRRMNGVIVVFQLY
jgi:hypothetical protein